MIASRKQQIATVALAVLAIAVAVSALMLTTGSASAGPSEDPIRIGKLGVGAMKVAPVEPVGVAEKFDTAGAAEAKALTTTIVRKDAPLPVVKAAATSASTSSRSGSSVSRSASSSGWSRGKVSWYGPGFYGNTMAGGGTLTPDSMVVAHRSLAFGTKVQFQYKGRTCTAVVQDRGPYISGRVFDLGPGTAKALGFSGVGTVEYRILGR